MNNFKLILLIKIAVILTYRLEPLQTWNSRRDLYQQNFYKFTEKLGIGFSKEKGYFCIANRSIIGNDSVFTIPRNYSFSVFDEFPFKSNYLKIL